MARRKSTFIPPGFANSFSKLEDTAAGVTFQNGYESFSAFQPPKVLRYDAHAVLAELEGGHGHRVYRCMTMLMAGGGVKRGAIVGATDELGAKAIEVAHPIRDLHVTLLHLLGLDDNKLTYFHAGRYKQLSQFGGQVIKELIA